MLPNILGWIRDLRLSEIVRESLWLFPTLECIHIYSMIFLISVIAAFDLRLAGVVGRNSDQPISRFSQVVFRCALVCIAANFITGGLLFASKAPDYYINPAFRIKMLLILISAVYHFVILQRASKWNDISAVSMVTRVLGVLSLLLWVGVIAASRWIAFV